MATLATGLAACGFTASSPEPIVVPFASSPYVFRGDWSGITRPTSTNATASEVKVNVTTSYTSATSYTFKGTLVMSGVTYALDGQANATGRVALKAQTSPIPDSFQWTANVSLANQVVGKLTGFQPVPQSDPNTVWNTLELNGQTYDLPLKRTQ